MTHSALQFRLCGLDRRDHDQRGASPPHGMAMEGSAKAADELNVARVCRHFGISRKSFYKWQRRHADHGAAGLCDRPRTPHRSPRATSRDVIRKILYLRQQYHFGPGRIATHLHRFHQILVARSSVHRILKRHGMSRLPANQKHRPYGRRWRRYEKLAPGHRLQVDVKFLERIPGTRRRLFQFTAFDDCTRIRVLKIFDACNQRTAIQFIDEDIDEQLVDCWPSYFVTVAVLVTEPCTPRPSTNVTVAFTVGTSERLSKSTKAG